MELEGAMIREIGNWKQRETHLTPNVKPNGAPNEDSWNSKIDSLRASILALLEEVEDLKVIRKEVEVFRKITANDEQGIDFYDEVRRFEIDLIRCALDHAGGHQARAARLLGLKATTLSLKMKRYGIVPLFISESVRDLTGSD